MNQFQNQQEMLESNSILSEIFDREFETDFGQKSWYYFDAWWATLSRQWPGATRSQRTFVVDFQRSIAVVRRHVLQFSEHHEGSRKWKIDYAVLPMVSGIFALGSV